MFLSVSILILNKRVCMLIYAVKHSKSYTPNLRYDLNKHKKICIFSFQVSILIQEFNSIDPF